MVEGGDGDGFAGAAGGGAEAGFRAVTSMKTIAFGLAPQEI